MKRSRGGRKRQWFGYLLSFLLGVLLTIGLYLYFSSKQPPPKPVDQGSPQNILTIEQVIHHQLSELGIPKKDIVFDQSSRKTSVIKIRSPRSLSFSVIERDFRKAIASLGKPFSIHSIQTAKSLKLEINTFDRVTHELTFIPALPPDREPVPPAAAVRPRIAIVIDDLGEEKQVAQQLLDWTVPVTFAILPFTSHARTLASEAHEKGKEVLLHLPMEPYEYPRARPGKGVLLHGMAKEKLQRQLLEDIDAVPHIDGVSNHMGSRLMEDPAILKVILAELKKRGLFFLDSRTTPRTVGFRIAKSLGMRSAERSVFLDHSHGEKAVKQSLEELIERAFSTGKAIGIGHPHPYTIKSLNEMIPKIQEKGIEIVPVSNLLE